MIDVLKLDELARRLAGMIPDDLKGAREDLSKNFRSVLQSSLQRLELVTREEFEVQREILRRTRQKLERLEQQIAELEKPAAE
ncbi:MAG: accessory factor UbiK family protein [Xanthomonadales bacterium]|nr:accessory factor UbiK family protein [Xanthomonadales bacterium]